MLPKIVSSNQGAFVLGRKLHHQAILAQELVHVLHKSKAKDGYVAVKVDMRQAYDRIEWVFIKETLKKLGVFSTLIFWIMECVKIPTFSNILNGEPPLSRARGDFGRVTHFPLYFMFLVWIYSQDIC